MAGTCCKERETATVKMWFLRSTYDLLIQMRNWAGVGVGGGGFKPINNRSNASIVPLQTSAPCGVIVQTAE